MPDTPTSDHGSFIWELRQFGDVHAGECWSYVQNFRQAARDFVREEACDLVGAEKVYVFPGADDAAS